jgi:hypothetical protein
VFSFVAVVQRGQINSLKAPALMPLLVACLVVLVAW